MSAPTFHRVPSDCAWLRETHLKRLAVPEFNSFVLHGNEDCPEKIELYSECEPLVTSPIVATYTLTEELRYEREVAP